jgi:hypothetical protein
LAQYLPSGDKDKDKNLPGEGGVFNTVNIDLYHYAGNNPVRFTDPDGNSDIVFVKNSNAQNQKFESTALVYKDGTLTPFKSGILNIISSAKGFFGSSLSEGDVKRVLGSPDKKFDDFSTLSDNLSQYGTAKSGEIFKYKQESMSWTDRAFHLYTHGGSDHIPQDPKVNGGINPNGNNTFLDAVFMHAAMVGDATQSGYLKGSHGCSTRQGWSGFYDYLSGLSNQSGLSGNVYISR